ncbi:MAG: AAA family ATPase [Parvibaculum sp.]|uniref:ATP-dependent nuclease n=1 Tax=Parvibaculum sp. TaxID=2024848 RepID=UPI0032651604
MDWAIPDQGIVCLIGRGDSTKSTVLEALRRTFFPQWNLSFDDADFYLCNPNNVIKIEAIVGEIPDEFRDLAKYGHWLCGWNKNTQSYAADPGEGAEEALRVRLEVSGDLEPSWSVVKNDGDEGVQFRSGDRARVAVSLIGSVSDRHLTWSRGSILSKLTESENISSSLADAARAAKAALEVRRDEDLSHFDQVAEMAENTARELGVRVSNSYRAQLDSDAINVRIAGLALHDGDLPLRQLGLGSKRMLMTGLQKQALHNPHVTLFDEVELGLEPHRIARLLKHLKEDRAGQYFLTTHSPVTLRELDVGDLHVVHGNEGHTDVVAVNKPSIAESIQGRVRSGAEAFLAPRIIVCEGATEVGFLRGLDDYWSRHPHMNSFAYIGVALFDARSGGSVRGVAEDLQALGFDIAVLADSDRPDQLSAEDVAALRRQGIEVAVWEGNLSIEQRVFADLPWNGVLRCIRLAGENLRVDQVIDQVGARYNGILDHDLVEWVESPQLRTAVGLSAKENGWFKRQSLARDWAKEISQYLEDPVVQRNDLGVQIANLRRWVDRV